MQARLPAEVSPCKGVQARARLRNQRAQGQHGARNRRPALLIATRVQLASSCAHRLPNPCARLQVKNAKPPLSPRL